jgi:hypothetical protein
MNSLIKQSKQNKLKQNKIKISNVIEKPEIDYIVIEKPINKIKKINVEIEKPLVIISYDPNDTTLYL